MGEPGSAIVLIHGIGDQAQGSTEQLFLGQLFHAPQSHSNW
jgi:hypothetical protein